MIPLGVLAAAAPRSESGPVETVWDVGVKGAGIALSNSNLNATKAGVGFQSAFATRGRSSGRYAFEVSVVALPNVASILVGVADKTSPANVQFICNTYVGEVTSGTLRSVGYNDFNGRIFRNMSAGQINGTTSTSYGADDIITVDVNIDAATIAFLKNGVPVLVSGSATLVMDAGRTWYPAISLQQGAVGRLVATGLTHLPAGAAEWGQP